MRLWTNINSRLRHYGSLLTISLLLIFICNEVFGQEPPPRPVQVTVQQNLAFGAFSHGATGGSVILDPSGSRSFSGDVILLNLGYGAYEAVYRLVANPGTIINILNGPDVSLTGSNGGAMLLHLGASSPVSPFVIGTTPPNYTLLHIGATLSVGNAAANPPGAYSGTFDIIFIQE
jgi:hypothetical protein